MIKIYLPIWQYDPEYPELHMQVATPLVIKQEPPFWHGFGLHAFDTLYVNFKVKIKIFNKLIGFFLILILILYRYFSLQTIIILYQETYYKS